MGKSTKYKCEAEAIVMIAPMVLFLETHHDASAGW